VDQPAPVSSGDQADVRAFSAEDVNHSHWIWGMTRSFLGSVLAGEGFELTWEERGQSMPNATWLWYRGLAGRGKPSPRHWSQASPQARVLDLSWRPEARPLR